MRKLIGFLLVLVIMSACNTEKRMSRKCAKAQAKYELASFKYGCPLLTKSDTVERLIYQTETRDTTIYIRIAADTVYSTDTVISVNGVTSTPKNRLDTEFAYSIAFVSKGVLYHVLYQKESVIAKTIEDAVKRESKVETVTVTNTVEHTTNILTNWQVMQMWLGRFMLVLVIALLCYLGLRIIVK